MKNLKYAAVHSLGQNARGCSERRLEFNPHVSSRIRIFEELIRANNPNNKEHVIPRPTLKRRRGDKNSNNISAVTRLASSFPSSSSSSPSPSPPAPASADEQRAGVRAGKATLRGSVHQQHPKWVVPRRIEHEPCFQQWQRHHHRKLAGSNVSLSGSSSSGYLSSDTPEPENDKSVAAVTRSSLLRDELHAELDPEDKLIEEEIFSCLSTDDEDINWSDLDAQTADDDLEADEVLVENGRNVELSSYPRSQLDSSSSKGIEQLRSIEMAESFTSYRLPEQEIPDSDSYRYRAEMEVEILSTALVFFLYLRRIFPFLSSPTVCISYNYLQVVTK